MSDKLTLTAEIREDVGKGASRRLRRSGDKVPAIIYGGENPPQTLTLSFNELTKAMQVEAFFSQILDVSVAGKAEQAVVRDLHRNPGNGRVMHVDFQRIRADQEMHVSVPLHFINEEQCVGVKMQNGMIAHNLTEVEIACLPANLPEYIEVDMLEIEAGGSVHLSDLALPGGVEIVALSYGDEDRDIPVASVTVRRGGADEDEESAEAAGDTQASADAADDADAGESSDD